MIISGRRLGQNDASPTAPPCYDSRYGHHRELLSHPRLPSLLHKGKFGQEQAGLCLSVCLSLSLCVEMPPYFSIQFSIISKRNKVSIQFLI